MTTDPDPFNKSKRPTKQKAPWWKRLCQRILLPALVTLVAFAVYVYTSTPTGMALSQPIVRIIKPPINDSIARLPLLGSPADRVTPTTDAFYNLTNEVRFLRHMVLAQDNVAQDPVWRQLQRPTGQPFSLPNMSHLINVTNHQTVLLSFITDAADYVTKVNSGNLTEISDALCHCETSVTTAVYPRLHNALLSWPKDATDGHVRRALDNCYRHVFSLLKPADVAPQRLHERIKDLLAHYMHHIKPAIRATFRSLVVMHGYATEAVDPMFLFPVLMKKTMHDLKEARSGIFNASRQIEYMCQTHVGRFQNPVDYLEEMMELAQYNGRQAQTSRTVLPPWVGELLPPREAARRICWALTANLGEHA
jgi:hypothetical protein